MSDNLKSRMLTVSSRRGEKASDTANNATAYSSLMRQVNIIDSKTWPANYEDVPMFGEIDIQELCSRFHIDSEKAIVDFRILKASAGRWSENLSTLQAVRNALSVIPVSTAECERSFSVMNTIATPKRNRLSVKNMSNLMFVSIMGPSLKDFNPTPYAKSWLQKGNHSAEDTNSIKRKLGAACSPFPHLNALLG